MKHGLWRSHTLALRAGALLLGFLAGAWGGAALARITFTTTSIMGAAVLQPDPVYRYGMEAVVGEITDSDFLQGLNRGPIEVSGEEVSRILHGTFDEHDTAAKSEELHSSLVDFTRRYQQGRAFKVEIADERPVLVDSLRRVVHLQYASLPDCDLGSDITTLLSAAELKLFGGSEREFFDEDHPKDCRPPDVVASRVEQAMDEEFREMTAQGPDSVKAFPSSSDSVAFVALMGRVHRGLIWTHWGWPILLMGLAIGVYAGGRAGAVGPDRWHPISSAALGLLVYAVAALVFAPDPIDAAFRRLGTEGEPSEAWALLGSYVFRRVATVSGLAAAAIASAAFAALVTFRAAARRRAGRGS